MSPITLSLYPLRSDLPERIRTCQNIKGINVFGQEIKISQYADLSDTTLILDG